MTPPDRTRKPRAGLHLMASAALAALVTAVLLAIPAAAADGGSLGIRLDSHAVNDLPPGPDDTNAASDRWVVATVAGGDVVTADVTVTNTTARPLHVTLYTTGATIADGRWVGHDTAADDLVSTSTTLTETALTLPAGGQAPVTATITIPDDVTSGDHYGVIWAHTTTDAPDGGTVGWRTGVRTYLTVPGPAPAPTTLTATAPYTDGPLVCVDVTATGAATQATATGQLTRPGITVDLTPAAPADLAPDVPTRTCTTPPDNTPAGSWDATVDVDATNGLSASAAGPISLHPADADIVDSPDRTGPAAAALALITTVGSGHVGLALTRRRDH